MGASCSTKKTTSKSCGKRKFRGGRKTRTRRVRGGRKTRTRRVRGGRKTRTRGGGCGCSAPSNSGSSLFGGYKYTRKASLAAEKRLSQRMSRRVTQHVKRRKHKRRKRGRR